MDQTPLETENLLPDPHEQYLHEYHQLLGQRLLSGEITLAEFEQELTARRLELEGRIDHDGILLEFWNHKGFKDKMEEHLAMAQRRPELFGCLLALDLDNLKIVNDTLGHPDGDKLIQAYGKVCQGRTRPGDILGKLGGDELFIYLVGITPEDALKKANQIRRSLVPAVLNAIPDIPWDQTTSIGITKTQPDDTYESLRERADQALLEAKKQRNQIVVK